MNKVNVECARVFLSLHRWKEKGMLGKLHELLQEDSSQAAVSGGSAGGDRGAWCWGCVTAAPAGALADWGIL